MERLGSSCYGVDENKFGPALVLEEEKEEEDGWWMDQERVKEKKNE